MFINDTLKLATIALPNVSVNGVIALPSNSVDRASSFTINQTTANITATIGTPTNTTEGDFISIRNIGTAFITINSRRLEATGLSGCEHFFTFKGGQWSAVGVQNPTIGNSNVVSMVLSAATETVCAFDGFEIKWHASSGTTYDGIAIRTQAGSRNIKYTQTEFYSGSSVHDSGKSTWGSDNTYYNLPNTGTTATVSTPAFPHLFALGTTFVGMGNPALPQSDYRIVHLRDDSNALEYRITVYKSASTGEVLSGQIGTCSIIVEKMGITGATPLTAGAGVSIIGNTINTTYPTVSTNAASYTVQPSDETIFLTLLGVQNVVLPPVVGNIGRKLYFGNPTNSVTGTSPQVSQKTFSLPVLDKFGNSITQIAPNSNFEIVSDGTAWRLIQGDMLMKFFSTGGINGTTTLTTVGYLGGTLSPSLQVGSNQVSGPTFTVPRTGHYTIAFTFAGNFTAGSIPSGTSGNYFILNINNATTGLNTSGTLVQTVGGTTGYMGGGYTITLPLVAGNVIQFRVYNSCSTNFNWGGNNDQYSIKEH